MNFHFHCYKKAAFSVVNYFPHAHTLVQLINYNVCVCVRVRARARARARVCTRSITSNSHVSRYALAQIHQADII